MSERDAEPIGRLVVGDLDTAKHWQLQRFYRRHSEKLRLQADDRVYLWVMDDPSDSSEGGVLVAAARLSTIKGVNPASTRWLRNVLVDTQWRGRGMSHVLLNALLESTPRTTVWTMPIDGLAPLYAAHGFKQRNVQSAPASLLGKWQSYARKTLHDKEASGPVYGMMVRDPAIGSVTPE